MNDRRELIVRACGGRAWTHGWAFRAHRTAPRAPRVPGVRLVAVASKMKFLRVERRSSSALCLYIRGRGRHVPSRLG